METVMRNSIRRPASQSAEHHYLGLFYGAAKRPLAVVVPDPTYPGMYRVLANGVLSDMVNYARAKDAAAATAERGPPARDPKRLHWQRHRSNSPYGARTAVSEPAPLSPLPAVADHGRVQVSL
jgi:hypothetical protein